MDLKEAALLGDQVDRHWYYRAKLAALLSATRTLPATSLLDVGAGIGFFARAMLAHGRANTATCIDPLYPTEHDETVNGAPLRFRRTLDEPGAAANLVLMMDVLEHVPDDVALVQEYADQLAPGTRFIVTVPAFQWLWSGHDVFLEHYRRYRLPQLEAVLAKAGLRVELGAYYYGAVLPAAAAMRLAHRLAHRFGHRNAEPRSDMRPLHPALNTLLLAACRAELPLMRANRLGGLTVFARAVKP